MEWYWYLIIALSVAVVFLLIVIFGNSTLKKFAYELVCNAENLVGSGNGEEKYNLVLENLSKLTKGLIPTWILKLVINWAVNRMKLLLSENTESTKKHLEEDNKGSDD